MIYLATQRSWPFDSAPPKVGPDAQPSLAQYFLADTVTLGFVRLAIVFLAGFVLVSIPALIVDSRWIKGFGTAGLTTDEAREASEVVTGLRELLATAEKERDEAIGKIEAALTTLDDALR